MNEEIQNIINIASRVFFHTTYGEYEGRKDIGDYTDDDLVQNQVIRSKINSLISKDYGVNLCLEWKIFNEKNQPVYPGNQLDMRRALVEAQCIVVPCLICESIIDKLICEWITETDMINVKDGLPTLRQEFKETIKRLNSFFPLNEMLKEKLKKERAKPLSSIQTTREADLVQLITILDQQ